MKTSKNSSKTRMPQRHPFIPSPHLKMNLFHSPSICQMENFGPLARGAIPVVFQGERIVEQASLSHDLRLVSSLVRAVHEKANRRCPLLAGKHFPQRPLYPFHSISNLVSEFLLLWDGGGKGDYL